MSEALALALIFGSPLVIPLTWFVVFLRHPWPPGTKEVWWIEVRFIEKSA